MNIISSNLFRLISKNESINNNLKKKELCMGVNNIVIIENL